MKRYIIFYLVIISHFNSVFLLIHEENKSYFAVIGTTGEGKSLFVNTISQKSKFAVSSKGNSETQQLQHIEFVFNKTSFVAIDTPGLDDSLYNVEKIQNLKTLIYEYQTIKALVIVKKYNNFRLSESLQEAIKVFMDSFPLENFWDHVIIVNTWANPKDPNFLEYYNKERQYFVDKIKNCPNLKEYMHSKGINLPEKIKEYFVDTKAYKKNKKIKEFFKEIKKDISNKEFMFKKVERGEIETSVEKTLKKNTYLVTKYRIITCTDFNDQKKEIKEIIEIKEEELSDDNKIDSKETKKLIKNDHIRWYDVLSISLTWWFRTKHLYEIYETGIHKIGGQKIIGEKIHTEDRWE